MTFNKSLFFSSAMHNWQTPPELYKELDDEFHFNFDVCTSVENPLGAPRYMVGEEGLHSDCWNGMCYMNPPYGKYISSWVAKAYEQSIVFGNCTVVALLPARTDTRWFHSYIKPGLEKKNGQIEIRFLKGRIKFVGAKHSAPFPSLIAIFRGSS